MREETKDEKSEDIESGSNKGVGHQDFISYILGIFAYTALDLF